ncbi:MAG: hypothetical protein AAGF67_13350 [Verrucomicrobiota bacterium]
MSARCFSLLLISCIGLPGASFAQTDEEKSAIIGAVGEQAGEALLSTHEAVNALPTIREGGVFPESEVKELATSYRESSELVLRLVGQVAASADQARIAKGCALLVEQAKAMEKIIHEGTMEIPASYTALQEKTSATLFGKGMPESQDGDAPATVKAIAESLRDKTRGVAEFEPTPEQIRKIAASDGAAAQLIVYAKSLYENIPADAISAKPGQTEVIVRGPGLDDLPGGYGDVMGNFRKGIEIYGFKFVEPGETLGMAFDGLFQVEGEWILIPKAWRAFQ